MGKVYASNLSERLLRFAVGVIKMLGEIEQKKEFDVIKYQLSKAATSIGANYEESQSTTRKEFPAKIRICVREGLESKYWLRVMLALELRNESRIEPLIRENEEIVKILKTILRKTSSVTAAMPFA
jgi:four helix bundle protein